MTIRIVCLLSTLLTLTLAWGATASQGEIPDHPRSLHFEPLEYQPPQRDEYRHVLKHGVVAYLVEDHELPLFTITARVRAGDYLDPQGKEGLASASGSLMRSGGTSSWSADEFDEEADFLAANLSSSSGETTGSVSVNALSKDMDRALELFTEMLKQPRFQQDRIDLYKSQVLQQMERRNDQTAGIERREWSRLLYGSDHYSNRVTTAASIESLSREDLIQFHQQYYQPTNFILAVSGDFQTSAMIDKLNDILSQWESPGSRSPEVPETTYTPTAGVYLVDKPDVNQGRVSIGHLSLKRGHPDQFALDLMNEVLGGSGFTSRITNRVRSDEGLAYSAGSFVSFGIYAPGVFRALFQSKSATCAEATVIVLEEIERIRNEQVSDEELETVRTQAIEVFPRFFSSAAAVAGTFANDELTGREADYWNHYRDRLKAVTREDVLRVAREHLHPDRLVVLAVGNVNDLLKGNADKPQYSFEALAGDGPIRRIPLPDPMTMIYPEQDQ